MSNPVMTRDKAGVMTVWEMQGKPFFSIWRTAKDLSFSCSEEEEEAREAMLVKYLDLIKESNSDYAYTIKFHDETGKSGKINNTTPVCGSLPFKFSEATSIERYTPGGAGAGNTAMLNELFAEKLARLEDKYDRRIEDLEREHEDEIEELEKQLSEGSGKKLDGIQGAIGFIGEQGSKYPWIAEIIKDWSTIIKHKFQQAAGPRPAHNIAGVETDTQAPPQGDMTADQQVSHAIRTMAGYYVGKHGYFDPNITEEAKTHANAKGWAELAADLTLLAGLTKDPDLMELALKKLRQLA